MAICILGKEPVFPSVNKIRSDGIIAVGGDLSFQRLINAYKNGIFPWYSDGGPILWWCPDPRLVLIPEELRESKSMKRVIHRNIFRISIDRRFADVINGCKQSRNGQNGTWITDEMEDAYNHLHRKGYAHSFEVWFNDELVGGVYGVSLGRCFFAESMFYRMSNASKFGLIKCVRKLQELRFTFLDCQVTSSHMKTLGAREIPRKEFFILLEQALKARTLKGSWTFLEDHK